MSKVKGRKRSNYGVSIYQEAPVVVQRKRKATEISIVENGVRIIGKGGPSLQMMPAPTSNAPVMGEGKLYDPSGLHTSAWLKDGMANQEVKRGDVSSMEPTLGMPMRRTRSSLRLSQNNLSQLDEAPMPMRPTVSGIAEALGVEDYAMRRSQSEQLVDALPFRPTISGLEEALDREAPLLNTSPQRSTASARQAQGQTLPPAPTFRPTISGLQESLLMDPPSQPAPLPTQRPQQRPAPQPAPQHAAAQNIPMRRTRSRSMPAEDAAPTSMPMHKTVSGILSSLLGDDFSQSAPPAQEEPPPGIPMRRTRSRGLADPPANGTLPMHKSVSGILNSLLADEPMQLEQLEPAPKAVRMTRSRAVVTPSDALPPPLAPSSRGSSAAAPGAGGVPSVLPTGQPMQRSVSAILSSLLSTEGGAEGEDLVSSLLEVYDNA